MEREVGVREAIRVGGAHVLLDAAVQKWISARELDEVVTAFNEAGAALAPIYDTEQLVNDPHVQARETITTVGDEDLGELRCRT